MKMKAFTILLNCLAIFGVYLALTFNLMLGPSIIDNKAQRLDELYKYFSGVTFSERVNYNNGCNFQCAAECRSQNINKLEYVDCLKKCSCEFIDSPQPVNVFYTLGFSILVLSILGWIIYSNRDLYFNKMNTKRIKDELCETLL